MQDNVFMSFGKMPIANNFLDNSDFKNEYFFKMDVAFEEKYSLFKLANFPKPEQMFNENYKFFTSSSKYMQKHFKLFFNKVSKEFLKTGSRVLEIGCNDGTLLSYFNEKNFQCLGFEPSSNVATIAKKKKIKVINDFFGADEKYDLDNYIKKTDLICAANVICHIPNLKALIENVDKFLSDNGVFIFEEPYLGSMFEKISYDQIYDEHVYIFSLISIKKLFEDFGYQLFDIDILTTHGGSIRYYLSRKGVNEISNKVKDLIQIEKQRGLDTLASCHEFKKNCELSKEKTLQSLFEFKKKGLKISGYAATSKSTTILNYCGIGTDLIDCIYDTTPEKVGKFSPGMHIPIVDHKLYKDNYPDISYLFAWNHKEEIEKKEFEFIKKGGKWFSHVDLK